MSQDYDSEEYEHLADEFQYAAESGDLETIRELLPKLEDSPSVDESFYLAAVAGHPDIVSLLMQHLSSHDYAHYALDQIDYNAGIRGYRTPDEDTVYDIIVYWLE